MRGGGGGRAPAALAICTNGRSGEGADAEQVRSGEQLRSGSHFTRDKPGKEPPHAFLVQKQGLLYR